MKNGLWASINDFKYIFRGADDLTIHISKTGVKGERGVKKSEILLL